MATRVAELYAELTLRDNSLNDGLEGARDNLNQLGQASDQAASQAQRAAARQAQAYRELQKETEKAYNAARTQASRAVTATERVEVVQRRLAEAVREHGQESEQAQRIERQLGQARSDAERITRNAERANDNYRISLQRSEQSQRDASRAAEQAGTSLRDLMQTSERAGRSMREAVPDEGQVNRFSSALTRAGEGMASLGGSAGGGMGGEFVSGFASRVQGLGGKGGPIVAALAGVAVIGVAAGAVLAGAIADGMEQEKGLDLIQAKLGTDEDTARRIGEAAGMSYTSGWGESVAGNMDGIRAAIQAGLLTGEEDTSMFKETIDQLNIVADLMGEDVPAVARAAGQAVKNGIAKDGTEAFDLLTRSAQGSLNVSEDLLDSQVEYSTQLRALGLEGAEGWALVSQGVKGGARDTDVVIDALKEFKLRASDGTAAAAVGFDKLGVSAQDFQSAMVQGGTASRDMMATMLRNLHEIKDPQDRYNAALALFGTKFEDIQGAVDDMNLDTAVKQFGEIEGAAWEAGNTMGSNTASQFDSAKRTIETSANAIKLALADAFGPGMTQAAQWVQTHKPEIIGFFTELATGALTTLDGMMAFSSGALRAWAFFAEGVGGTIGTVVQQMASLVDAQASVLDLIPGMDGQADDFRGIAEGMRGFAESVGTAGDKARGMADVIDQGRPIIQGMRDDVAAAGQAAQNSELMMRALGEGVNAVPNDKNIIITDTTPEIIANLEGLNLKTRTLEDGTVEVFADTAAGQRIIDDWIRQPRNTNVTVTPVINQQAWADAQRAFNSSGQQGPVAPVFRADGVVIPKNTDPHIQRTEVTTYGERETEGEAYIPFAEAKRPRSEALLGQVAEMFGLGLFRKGSGRVMADGDVVDSLTGIQQSKFPALQVTDTYRPGAADYHGAGKAVDFSNGSGNTDDQLAFANYMADNYQEQLAELIYIDPRFGRCIKDGKFVPDSFYAGAGDHTNHVHVAAKEALSESPTQSSQAPDNRSEREKIVDTIVAEGRRRGISEKGIKAAIAAGLAETDLQNLDHGMDGDNAGILQQRDNGAWGTLEDRKDPARAVGMFYDKLDDFDYESMDPADAAQKVQQSGTADGSNYRAELGEADQLYADSVARGTSTSPPAGDSPSSSSGSSMSGGVQDVRVTNFMDLVDAVKKSGDAGKPQEPQPWLTGNLRMYANGDIRNGHEPQIARPGDYRVFGEEETNGEAYIPFALSKRARALAIWRETGRRLGVAEFSGGGFGGYSGPDTEDYMKPKNLYDAAALATGIGFTAVSGASNIVGMAQSGQWDLSKLMPSFDTSNNDIPGLSSAFEQVTQQLEQIAETLQKGGMIQVDIDVDSNGVPSVSFTKAGLG
ncbi:phage tail tape measure protein [Rhodococcus opacus]|uniref:phage tail tape measure protein n=1 Tax=Rhodococcus opacus TaxID=37919 RepID=UPI0006BB5321|nr:phage tail tape measure protein [Rhodococcus opacus]